MKSKKKVGWRGDHVRHVRAGRKGAVTKLQNRRNPPILENKSKSEVEAYVEGGTNLPKPLDFVNLKAGLRVNKKF